MAQKKTSSWHSTFSQNGDRLARDVKSRGKRDLLWSLSKFASKTITKFIIFVTGKLVASATTHRNSGIVESTFLP